MPGWLQSFVKVNPITHLVGAVRGLMLGGPLQTHLTVDAGLDGGPAGGVLPAGAARLPPAGLTRGGAAAPADGPPRARLGRVDPVQRLPGGPTRVPRRTPASNPSAQLGAQSRGEPRDRGWVGVVGTAQPRRRPRARTAASRGCRRARPPAAADAPPVAEMIGRSSVIQAEPVALADVLAGIGRARPAGRRRAQRRRRPTALPCAWPPVPVAVAGQGLEQPRRGCCAPRPSSSGRPARRARAMTSARTSRNRPQLAGTAARPGSPRRSARAPSTSPSRSRRSASRMYAIRSSRAAAEQPCRCASAASRSSRGAGQVAVAASAAGPRATSTAARPQRSPISLQSARRLLEVGRISVEVAVVLGERHPHRPGRRPAPTGRSQATSVREHLARLLALARKNSSSGTHAEHRRAGAGPS